jgi:hypothetical protein
MPTWRGGRIMKLETQTAEGSPLAMAVVAAILAVAGCAVAGVSALVGAPLPVTVAAFLTPSVVYFLIFIAVHLTRRRAPGRG